METIKFHRGPAQDCIHNDIEFNEYHNKGERMVTIGQLVGGTLGVFALALMYALFGMLEG